VKPGLLTLMLPEAHLRILPGGEVPVSVRLQRADGATGRDVQLELVVPPGVEGISAEPVKLMANDNTAILAIKFSAEALVPEFPVILRATTAGGDTPFIAEAKLELLPAAGQ
jgi:hypothetical protein